MGAEVRAGFGTRYSHAPLSSAPALLSSWRVSMGIPQSQVTMMKAIADAIHCHGRTQPCTLTLESRDHRLSCDSFPNSLRRQTRKNVSRFWHCISSIRRGEAAAWCGWMRSKNSCKYFVFVVCGRTVDAPRNGRMISSNWYLHSRTFTENSNRK